MKAGYYMHKGPPPRSTCPIITKDALYYVTCTKRAGEAGKAEQEGDEVIIGRSLFFILLKDSRVVYHTPFEFHVPRVCQEAVLRALVTKATGGPKLVLSPPSHYVIPLNMADSYAVFGDDRTRTLTIIGEGMVTRGESYEPHIPAYAAIAMATYAHIKPCNTGALLKKASLPPLARTTSYSSGPTNRSLSLSEFRVNKKQHRTPEDDKAFYNI